MNEYVPCLRFLPLLVVNLLCDDDTDDYTTSGMREKLFVLEIPCFASGSRSYNCSEL